MLTYFDDTPRQAVVWMPAHTPEAAVGHRRLGDGSLLTAVDRQANAEVDRLAKAAVEEDRVPEALRKLVAVVAGRVSDIARWIGRATVAANEHQVHDGDRTTRIRDATVPLRVPRAPPRCRKPGKLAGTAPPPVREAGPPGLGRGRKRRAASPCAGCPANGRRRRRRVRRRTDVSAGVEALLAAVRPLGQSTAPRPSGAERLAALHARVLARERAAVCP